MVINNNIYVILLQYDNYWNMWNLLAHSLNNNYCFCDSTGFSIGIRNLHILIYSCITYSMYIKLMYLYAVILNVFFFFTNRFQISLLDFPSIYISFNKYLFTYLIFFFWKNIGWSHHTRNHGSVRYFATTDVEMPLAPEIKYSWLIKFYPHAENR